MYGDSELSVLRVVFAFHVVDRIVHADERVEPEEIDWVRARFPRDLLASHGLIDARDTLTDRYRDLLAEALMRLPAELDKDAKRALIREFFSSALVDDDLEVREGHEIVTAARLLGLPLDDVHAVLDEDDRFGDVELGDPVGTP